MFRNGVLIFFLLLLNGHYATADAVILENGTDYYSNLREIEYFVDQSDSLTIGEITNPEIARFQESEAPIPSFGFSRHPVWIKLTVRNQSSREQWCIETMNVFIDHAELHVPSRDIQISFDRSLPPSSRQFGSQYPTFSVDLPFDEELTLYLRYYSQDTLYLPITIKSTFALHSENRMQHMLFGILFGIALMMLIYNLYTYFTTFIKTYLFYSLYLIFFIAWAVSISGFGYLYLWDQYPLFNAYSAVLSANLFAIFLCLFTNSFLNLQREHPRLYYVVGAVLAVAFVILGLTPFTSLRVQAQLLNLISLAVAPVFILAASYSLYRGNRSARYYLLAYLIWWFFMGIWIGRNVGFLNESFFTRYAIYFGSITEIVLFSFALSDKMAISKKESARALNNLVDHQKETLEMQRKMVQSFSRFVPAEFLKILGRKAIMDVRLGDHVENRLTIMFVDIRSFTSLAESMQPEETFNFINSYLKRICPVIRAKGGFIDKYIGDGIMALFPEKPDSAVDAVDQILEALILYNKHRHNSGYKAISISIGVHTGQTILGTIGERGRIETTVISDAVNLASRLEELNRYYGSTLIISEDSFAALERGHQYQFRKVDLIRVKGKNQPVYIYQYLDRIVSPNGRDEAVGLYERALDYYVSGNIEAADGLFRQLAGADRGDRAARIFVERCANLLLKGIPDEWQGVEDLHGKNYLGY